jgi:hypothetical protein
MHLRSLIHYRSWETPVAFRYALLLTLLWPFQRYTRWTAAYHRVWAAATAIG